MLEKEVKRGKKGLSGVIITIFLVLISITTVIIVWQVLKLTLKEGVGEISFGRVLVDLELEKGSVKINDDSVSLKIKRNIGKGELVGIRFVLENGTDSYINESSTTMQELFEETFTIDTSGKITNIIEIKFSPIIKDNSGKEKFGSVIYAYKNKETISGAVTESSSEQSIYRGYIIEFKEAPLIKKYIEEKNKTHILFSLDSIVKQHGKVIKKEHESFKNKIDKNKIRNEFYSVYNGMSLDISDEEAREIKKFPEVKAVYPNMIVNATLMDSVPLINADDVWQLDEDLNPCAGSGKDCLTGKDVTIAILDTGIDYTHKDLGGNGEVINGQEIEDNYNKQENPAIYGDKIVWQESTWWDGWVYAYPQIQLYDLNTHEKIPITSSLNYPKNPAIYGDKIVWKEYGYLKMCDLTKNGQTGGCLSTDVKTQINGGYTGDSLAAIYNNIIVWEDTRNGKDIYMCDLTKNGQTGGCLSTDVKTQVTTNSLTQNNPAIYGDKIVWQDNRNGNYDIYMYDLSTGQETRITTDTSNQNTPAIYGDKIVWQDTRNGDKILWENSRNVNYDIYLYALTTQQETQITCTITIGEIAPAIYGDKIVWKETEKYENLAGESKNNQHNIFFYDITQENKCNNFIPPTLPNSKVIGGWDFVDCERWHSQTGACLEPKSQDSSPLDQYGHGTHVAGIAAGSGQGGLKGVAPDAKIYAYKVLNSEGSGSYDWVIGGIERAVDPNQDLDFSDHVDIISMSLGHTYLYWNDPAVQALDNAVDNGVIAVVAAGNSYDYQTINAIGISKKVITVGATDKLDVVAEFSSKGPSPAEGFITKPDIVAPGVDICSAQWDSFLDIYNCLDDKHITLSGTSMATPIVSGAAALLKQKFPNLNPPDIKSILMGTSTQNIKMKLEKGHNLCNSGPSSFETTEICTLSYNIGKNLEEALVEAQFYDMYDTLGVENSVFVLREDSNGPGNIVMAKNCEKCDRIVNNFNEWDLINLSATLTNVPKGNYWLCLQFPAEFTLYDQEYYCSLDYISDYDRYWDAALGNFQKVRFSRAFCPGCGHAFMELKLGYKLDASAFDIGAGRIDILNALEPLVVADTSVDFGVITSNLQKIVSIKNIKNQEIRLNILTSNSRRVVNITSTNNFLANVIQEPEEYSNVMSIETNYITIPANSESQITLKLNIPQNLEPGYYSGKIELSDGVKKHVIPYTFIYPIITRMYAPPGSTITLDGVVDETNEWADAQKYIDAGKEGGIDLYFKTGILNGKEHLFVGFKKSNSIYEATIWFDQGNSQEGNQDSRNWALYVEQEDMKSVSYSEPKLFDTAFWGKEAWIWKGTTPQPEINIDFQGLINGNDAEIAIPFVGMHGAGDPNLQDISDLNLAQGEVIGFRMWIQKDAYDQEYIPSYANYVDGLTYAELVIPIPISECTTITKSGEYILTQDIINNELTQDCIKIQASGVTIDCMGKKIQSNKPYAGIYSNQDYTTIKNCNIRMGSSSGTGIKLESSSNSVVENVNASLNQYGVYISGGSNNNINNLNVSLNTGTQGQTGVGLTLYLSSNNVIDAVNADSNSHWGVWIVGGSGNTIKSVNASNSQWGIQLSSASNNNLININSSLNSLGGIWLASSSGNTLSQIITRSNIYQSGSGGQGIYLYESRNNIINDINAGDNKMFGISLYSNSNNNLIENSRLCGNGQYDFKCATSSGNSGAGNILTNVQKCSDNWPSSYNSC